MKKYITLLIVNLLCCIAHSQEPDYGLEFRSFEVTQEKRTSLNLTPEKPLEFNEGFTLSFDMYYPNIDQLNYGYVFRLIGANGQHIDFLVNIERLRVVNSNGIFLATCRLNQITNFPNDFFNFTLSLDIQKNKLRISMGDSIFTPEIADLKDFSTFYLIFGKSDFPNLQTNDIPQFILKDIKIKDQKGKPHYHWKLFKHAENGNVYDELRKSYAKAENPGWLIDEHAFWKKRAGLQTMINPQIAFDSNNNLIAIADASAFRIYDTKTHSVRKSLNTDGLLHSQSANQLVYNHWDNQYYSYCFDTINGVDIAVFDTLNNRWDNRDFRETEIEFWHHNKVISREDSSLFVFHGYGHHRYKNVVNQYSFGQKQWKNPQLSGDVIFPRYLSGLGVLDDRHIIIFGGFGSEKKLQELTPRNYYDLHVIDLHTMKSKKIYELPSPQNNFVVANSLVVDTAENRFYALCFPQNLFNSCLFLAEFSLNKPEFKTVSDSIPFPFIDITSYADLFLNKETNELTAITFSSKTEDATAAVSIYTLRYPPVAEADLFQTPAKDEKPLPIPYLIIALLCLACAGGYFIFRTKRRKKETPQQTPQEAEETTVRQTAPKPFRKREQKQSVYLFGGFQVNDKDGHDVTGEFSPLLKHLFLIILLHTLKEDRKGITSAKLKETFWYDKSADSARNNRGVTFSKIRQTFEQIGYINIDSAHSCWTMQLGDEIRCDYRDTLVLMQQLEQKQNRRKEDIKKLIDFVSMGELLPDVQTEWIDSFKADFTGNLTDLLLDISQQKEPNLTLQDTVNLADAILIHDVLNENALRLKCSALVKMGKNGLAKTVYNSFINEYSASFGTPFKLSFEQAIV